MNELEKKLKLYGIEDFQFEAKQLSVFSGKDLENALARRLLREPLQYILGEWEFYSLPFCVGPGVLIPRADTETLVDVALKVVKKDSRVIDLCSGSGCVAIAIEKNSGCFMTALENSEDAIKYLKLNIEKNRSNIKIIQEDIFKFVPNEKVDVILSNPPYIKTKDLKFLQKEVTFEPLCALDGGEDGLLFYRRILEFIPFLNPGGHIIVEVGYDTSSDVQKLFENAGLITKAVKDLSGINRVIFGTLAD